MEPQLKEIIKKLIAKTNNKNICWEKKNDNDFVTHLACNLSILIGITTDDFSSRYWIIIYNTENGYNIYINSIRKYAPGYWLLKKLYNTVIRSCNSQLFKKISDELDAVYVQTVFPNE
jgi:hypothetical protein